MSVRTSTSKPSKGSRFAWYLACAVLVCLPACAQQEGERGARLKQLRDMVATQRENAKAKVSQESLGAVAANTHQDTFGGRDMLVYLPARMPPSGQRSMIVALHGGGGNAQFMVDHLKINGIAERHGFIVAYLEGSAAAERLGGKLKAWNAGSGCCGKPNTDKVDDVGYITGAVRYLQHKHGVNAAKTFGVGHSNGALMTQTMACVSTLYTTVATLSGTMMAEVSSCPAARGHTIYNYHGTVDVNLPIAGGFAQKGVTNIRFTPQSKAKELFEASGGRYVLKTLPGADHSIEHISEALQKLEGLTVGDRIARDFGLAPS